MSHDIATHGREERSFYSLRANPWHGLGTVVERPLADPQIKQLAGLAWEPERQNLYTQDLQPVPTHVAISRSDDHRILGVVGRDYQPLTNDRLFSFLREAAGWSDLTVETAGALGQGETVWALARVPDLDLVLGDDFSQGYLLITNNHVGRSRVTIMPTQIRVVCRNTLSMAMTSGRRRRSIGSGFAIRHSSGLERALADVADAYAQALRHHHRTVQAAEHLAGSPLTEKKLRLLIDSAFKVDDQGPDESGRARSIRLAREQRVQSILASPTCQVPATRDSLWSAYNAVTEYVDHERSTRTSGGQSVDEQRFASSVWGSGAQVKARALSMALELAK